MAAIKHVATGSQYKLYSHFTVGRSRGLALSLANRMVSGQHAAFRWTGEDWELVDLASSNGTYVDGVQLALYERRVIGAGARVAFGDTDDVFEMTDDSPPEPTARDGVGRLVYGQDGVLALPDSREATLVVYQDARRQTRPGQNFRSTWVSERPGCEPHPVQNGEMVRCGEQVFQLILPVRWERTYQPNQRPPAIDQLELGFFEGVDDEFISLVVRHAQSITELPHRAHYAVLLELARQRLEDQMEPDLPACEHGWMAVGDLLRYCDINEAQLNVHVHRARSQLSLAGIEGAQSLIERRHKMACGDHAGLRQLRIGVARLAINH